MKRTNKIRFSYKQLFSDILTHIYGIITVISFIIALVFAILTMTKNQINDNEVFYVCLGLITILCFVIIRISAKYSQLHYMSVDLLNYQRENSNLITLQQLQAETTHNIIHYYRNVTFEMDVILEKINCTDQIDQKEIDNTIKSCEHFLIILTSSLQNYFAIYSDDNCSIALKILSEDKKRLKTVFRDSVNLKKRRQAELFCGNESYDVTDNTAFNVILSDEYKDFYYANDNLEQAYLAHNYINGNKNWNSLYNSTIVVPISKLNHEKNERNILGFLTVDNKQGYLVDNTTIEYMLGISDLLYNFVLKLKIICNFTQTSEHNNEKQNDFIWN